jgi:CelD/BcsL family acetyltransferase involved in cellulose biosynthesis
MHIDVIDRFERFREIKDDWRRVYAADGLAQVYLSWAWMAQWLPLLKSRWFILAAKASPNAKKYVAFFPLRARTHMANKGGFFTEIAMAGNRFADYTGFLCEPDFRLQAAAAFGKNLKTMNWAAIKFESIRASSSDLNRLLGCFPEKDFSIERRSMVDADSGIDNSICPYVDLAESWDLYLAGLSSNTRQKLKRLLRKVENGAGIAVAHATADTIDRDIETLLRFWSDRWARQKGAQAQVIEQNLRVMLRLSFNNGNLLMPVLFSDGTAVGAHGVLVDDEKKVLSFLVGSRDQDFGNPQPGLTLHAHTIRHGIDQGFKRYDFLRGNEPYKYSFGSSESRISSTIVSLKPGKRKRPVLDKRSLPEALARVRQLHADGKAKEAEIGYRQILKLDEQCAPALYGFGGLMMAQREPVVAEAAFRSLLSVSGHSEKAWLALANSLAAQHRWSDAEEARGRATALAQKAVLIN